MNSSHLKKICLCREMQFLIMFKAILIILKHTASSMILLLTQTIFLQQILELFITYKC